MEKSKIIAITEALKKWQYRDKMDLNQSEYQASGGRSYYQKSDRIQLLEHEWFPDLDMAQTMMLVNEFRGSVELKRQEDHWFVTLYVPSMQYRAVHPSLTEAICEALHEYVTHANR